MTLQQLQDYFTTLAPDSVLGFSVNLVLAAFLTTILSRFYIKYGRSYSDRHVLANNFIIITLTTMMVITVIKSSLALSLGLVGALSIVRFRTAIKEPEELAYLFLCIGIGLGLGASARRTTFIVCGMIFCIIWYRANKRKEVTYPNLSLIVSKTIGNGQKAVLKDLIEIIKKHCSRVDVIRFEESQEHLESSFHIECASFDSVQFIRDDIKKADDAMHITFIDNSAGKVL